MSDNVPYEKLPEPAETCIKTPTFNTNHYKVFTSAHGFSNLLLGVTLFSIFLIVFYFTYTAQIEGEIVKEQVKTTIDELAFNIKNSGIDMSQAKQFVNNISTPDMSEADKDVEKKNKELLTMCIWIMGIFAMITFGIIILIKFFFSFSLIPIILINLLLVGAVAGIEILFLNVIVKNYRSLDSNFVKKTIVDEILKFKDM